MAKQDGAEREQPPSSERACAVQSPVSSIHAAPPRPRLTATTQHPLIYITALVPKVTVCIFCYRQHKVLFLGQFRSSGSCSPGLYCAGLLQNVFKSCFGFISSLFTHSNCSKLLLWMLKTPPLNFQCSFYLGRESYVISELRALSPGELVCSTHDQGELWKGVPLYH